MDARMEWAKTKDELVQVIRSMGYPDELGEMIAKNLGSPKAIRRFIAYLYSARPRSAEELVDEMLAIQSEIDLWRKKKESEEANRAYNILLNDGPTAFSKIPQIALDRSGRISGIDKVALYENA